jgi:hypothetical protein
MKRSAVCLAALLVAGAAQAADGFSGSVGVEYSSGDYGSDTETEILSVPVGAKYTTGDWILRASLPWMRVDGDANVVPGLGEVSNTNPRGRGRGNGNGGGGDPTVPTTGITSGIGDLRLTAIYAVPMQGDWGVDLSGQIKIATADEDKGLGTGANDYGVAVDLFRSFGDTTAFGGLGYAWLGDSDFIDVDSVLSGNLGVSHKMGERRSLGVVYDYRQPASEDSDDRSEVTGFYSFPTSEQSKMQFYATKGLSDGSPDWGAGVSLSAAF